MRKRLATIALVLAFAGCSNTDDSNSSPDQMQTNVTVTTPTIGGIDDLPADAISTDPVTGETVIRVGTVADIGGHAGAISANPSAQDSPAAWWIDLGVEPEQATCYADLFDRNGWTATTEVELAAIQSSFTNAEAQEFASC